MTIDQKDESGTRSEECARSALDAVVAANTVRGPERSHKLIEGRHAIISPGVDALCAGGASLLLLVPLLVTGRWELLILSAGVQAWVGAFVNMPHFLASYRMVYRTRASIRAHPWAGGGVEQRGVSGHGIADRIVS